METTDYTIKFTGLKLGKHAFSFDLKTDLFTDTNYSTLDFVAGKAEVELNKKENLMELNAHLKLDLCFPCDRCGELYQQKLEFFEHIVFKFGEEKELDSDELIILSPNAYKFSLKELYYEWIIVNLPAQRIHPEDESGQPTCKAEHLERVQRALSSEVSEESAEDERWSELKKLITKN
ncbi:MAG: YceD family protein [Flavobacteriales bacterium]